MMYEVRYVAFLFFAMSRKIMNPDVSRLKKNPLQCHYNQKFQILSKNCDSFLAKVLILVGKPLGNLKEISLKEILSKKF